MTAELFAVATFCDDIRHERGNKHSLIGCYSDELILDAIPTVMARLCASVIVMTPLDFRPDDVTVRASLNDDTIGELTIPAEEVAKAIANVVERSKRGNYGDQRMGLHMLMTFSPLAVPEPSMVRIDVVAGETKTRAGRLTLRLRTPDDPPF